MDGGKSLPTTECHLFQWLPPESSNKRRVLLPDMPRRDYRSSGGTHRSGTLACLTALVLAMTLGSGRAGEPGWVELCQGMASRALLRVLSLLPAYVPSPRNGSRHRAPHPPPSCLFWFFE